MRDGHRKHGAGADDPNAEDAEGTADDMAAQTPRKSVRPRQKPQPKSRKRAASDLQPGPSKRICKSREFIESDAEEDVPTPSSRSRHPNIADTTLKSVSVAREGSALVERDSHHDWHTFPRSQRSSPEQEEQEQEEDEVDWLTNPKIPNWGLSTLTSVDVNPSQGGSVFTPGVLDEYVAHWGNYETRY